tara:strand:+ start:1521 stop:1910 length:390 start_codon:yes stop_codon:yes gene_type:complete
MKNIVITLLISSLTFVSAAKQKQGITEVSGKSSVSVASNQVVFSLTIKSSNVSFSKCLDELNAQVTKLKSETSAKAAGVEIARIKKTSYGNSSETRFGGQFMAMDAPPVGMSGESERSSVNPANMNLSE